MKKDTKIPPRKDGAGKWKWLFRLIGFLVGAALLTFFVWLGVQIAQFMGLVN